MTSTVRASLAKRRALYKKRKASGGCHGCAGRSVPGKTLCALCMAALVERSKKNRVDGVGLRRTHCGVCGRDVSIAERGEVRAHVRLDTGERCAGSHIQVASDVRKAPVGTSRSHADVRSDEQAMSSGRKT